MYSLKEEFNEEMLWVVIDVIDKYRDVAFIRIQNYQQAVARYYKSRVKPQKFKVGDLVLRKVKWNTMEPGDRKLEINWKGPYRVTVVVCSGVYKFIKLKTGKQWREETMECHERQEFLSMSSLLQSNYVMAESLNRVRRQLAPRA